MIFTFFSPGVEVHEKHVRQVLFWLLEHNLFVKAEKCEFHSPSVSFLGFIVSEDQVSMDPEKVAAVKDWPTPTSRKQLERFLGFAHFYRKFIKGFSSIASPLHALTFSKTQFVWAQHAEEAFQELKERFTTTPVLTLLDPKLQFVVEVDASDVRVGAVLSQRSETDDHLHPCAYLSRKLSSAERNYNTGNFWLWR